MSFVRIFVVSLITALVLSLGTSGIAAAAGGVAHETHCAERLDQVHDHHGVAQEKNLKSLDRATPASAVHDHETCMIHACPALFPEAVNYQVEPYFLFAKLQFIDAPMQLIERVESLHRPPNT